MKRNRWIVISIIVINICIICTCAVLILREDRTTPEFRFQPSDYTYLRSDGEEMLLQDIIAYDNRDGIITDRIVIEKIVENQDSSTAVVYYAVSDLAGNVAKVSRIFPMEPADEVPEYVTEQSEEMMENEQEETPETEEENEEAAQQDEEQDTDQEPEEEENQPEEEEEADDESEETDENNDEEEARAEEEEPEPEPEPVRQTVDRSGYPVLTLKKSEVTIQAGTSPPWTELIETMRDDKDDYTTLYYNLHISKFTSGKAGDYPVTLQAEDTDGNLSDPVTVTVHVRE